VELIIGKYRIVQNHGLWIFKTLNDMESEGIKISEDKLEKAIEDFFNKQSEIY